MKKCMERKKIIQRRKATWRRVLKERSLKKMPRMRYRGTKITLSHVLAGRHLGWTVMERHRILISHPRHREKDRLILTEADLEDFPRLMKMRSFIPHRLPMPSMIDTEPD
jgi:hypothetical protein